MMRTKYFFLLFFLTAVLLFPGQAPQDTQNAQDTQKIEDSTNTETKPKAIKPRKFDIEVAYIFREESKVIDETDLHCTHFITKDQSEDILITGSESMVWGKTDYSDNERMFINKGSQDGIKDMDVFMVLGKGSKIYNPLTNKSMGTYYLKKALAKIYCLYEDKATISLMNGCQPVQIGDILIPYKPIEPMIKKKLDYQLCRLPQGAVEGHVVYTNLYTDVSRQMASAGEYVTIDIGNSMVSMGDWVIFYMYIKKELPPFITGFGIVIDAQNASSTVKVMDTSQPIEVGMPMLMMPPERATATPLSTTTATGPGQEDRLPTMDGLKSESESFPGEQLNIDVLFEINDIIIEDGFKPELEKITTFIADKSEYIIILRGYACSIGGLEYNLKLSKNRVDNIKKYLMETFNIKEEFIESYFYGEKDPVYDNSSEEERRKNRRVSMEVRGK